MESGLVESGLSEYIFIDVCIDVSECASEYVLIDVFEYISEYVSVDVFEQVSEYVCI